MKKYVIILIVLVVFLAIVGGISKREKDPLPSLEGNVPATDAYVNQAMGFSIMVPERYDTDESVAGQVKFIIPADATVGTNLSTDTRISVEQEEIASSTQMCEAELFIDGAAVQKTFIQDGVAYSVASSSDAAAGNRYEETVYALADSSPCTAVRYFIHYGNIQNYPDGAVKEFDKGALVSEFDAIRKTLKLTK